MITEGRDGGSTAQPAEALRRIVYGDTAYD
jgi:hypothetical protein